MKTTIAYLLACLFIAGLTTGLFAEEKTEKKDSKKEELTTNVNEAKAAFLKQDEEMKGL